jgi:hypothetical protein
MKKQPTQFDYSTLVSYMLPKGILDSFEINRIEEEDLGIEDETGTEIRALYIYLDERDLRDEVWHDLKPNGFTEAREFNDFPVREYKVVLHVRRRRWLSADGKNIILDSPALVADGTSYSVEFAAFLKEVVGYLPSNGPLRGAILPM